MPPKRKEPQVVRWLVQGTRSGALWWMDVEPTPWALTQVSVIAYGMDDGMVRWRA